MNYEINFDSGFVTIDAESDTERVVLGNLVEALWEKSKGNGNKQIEQFEYNGVIYALVPAHYSAKLIKNGKIGAERLSLRIEKIQTSMPEWRINLPLSAGDKHRRF